VPDFTAITVPTLRVLNENYDRCFALSEFYEGCRSELDKRRIDWTFIPPSAPHFGGLWEAGIKSTKYHLRRFIGDQILTRDDMCTLLSEVGACLNSRPLYPTSNDPSDLNVITPGHFLVGESLVGLPEPDEDEEELYRNHKQHLELIYRLRNNFWRRWSRASPTTGQMKKEVT